MFPRQSQRARGNIAVKPDIDGGTPDCGAIARPWRRRGPLIPQPRRSRTKIGARIPAVGTAADRPGPRLTDGRTTVGGTCSHGRMIEVVVGALVRGRDVLLAYRGQTKRAYPAVWELPGGVVEPGESELDALARELREELGVRIASGSASHLCRLAAGPADEPALLSAWLVTDWHGTPANLAPDEHDDIRWFDVEDLPPPAHVPVRAALVAAVRGQMRSQTRSHRL